MSYDSTLFVLSWDMHGLESCINATELDQQRTLEILGGKGTGHNKLGHIVSHLQIRAQANSQRYYEIYSIAVDSTISKEDLVEQFEENPQAMADLVRNRGNKIYSNRLSETDKSRIKIT
jgi:hypothetical protein